MNKITQGDVWDLCIFSESRHVSKRNIMIRDSWNYFLTFSLCIYYCNAFTLFLSLPPKNMVHVMQTECNLKKRRLLFGQISNNSGHEIFENYVLLFILLPQCCYSRWQMDCYDNNECIPWEQYNLFAINFTTTKIFRIFALTSGLYVTN